MSEKTRVRYYKATRPNGTDFWGGTIDYGAALETGAVLEHPEKFECNNPATYFSVSIAPTDCTGMKWPCRLFRIEPVGRAWRYSKIANKRCCSRLRVVEELPAHEALGPQGAEVAALIERAGRLTGREVEALEAALRAEWLAARGAAQDAARDAARGAAWGAARGAAWGAARGAAWGAAQDAARGAAWALLTRDLITPEQFDTLYGPWAQVIDKETSHDPS